MTIKWEKMVSWLTLITTLCCSMHGTLNLSTICSTRQTRYIQLDSVKQHQPEQNLTQTLCFSWHQFFSPALYFLTPLKHFQLSHTWLRNFCIRSFLSTFISLSTSVVPQCDFLGEDDFDFLEGEVSLLGSSTPSLCLGFGSASPASLGWQAEQLQSEEELDELLLLELELLEDEEEASPPAVSHFFSPSPPARPPVNDYEKWRSI